MKGLTLRAGSVRVKIFANRTVGTRSTASVNKVYTRWEIRWTDHHGRRRRLKRSNRAEALREARRLADDLARGHHHSELTLADLASFRAGIVNLYGTGKTLELATAEYAALRRKVPHASPEEIGDFFLAHRPHSTIDLSVEQAIDQFLVWKQQSGMSQRYHRTLKCLLAKFAKAHTGPISSVTSETVNRWIHALPGASPRTRNNQLAVVQSLFNLPALDSHPHRAAIRRLAAIREAAPSVSLWKPEEFRHLLETALLPYTIFNRRTRRDETRSHSHLVPVLVLGGFCKLRSAEIARVLWENIRLDDAQLLLEAGQTKNRRMRIVPMPENAVAWLRRDQQPSGKVWTLGDYAFHRQLRALALRCKLPWRRNGMRKSANTFSMLMDPNLQRVSNEAGNSPAVLERNYLRFQGITRRDAEAWFAIMPPANSRKIVPLDAGAVPKSVPETSPSTP